MREIIKEWTAALRSKQFAQGRQLLKVDNKYCCLGVLCEVLKVPEVVTPDGHSEFNNDGHGIPQEVSKKLGISRLGNFDYLRLPADIRKRFSIDDRATYEHYLSDANDLWRLNFDEIADLIEAIEENGAWTYA